MEYHVARLLYQYRKLADIKKGMYPLHGGDVEFELFGFFEVSYHLKDYIKESPDYSKYSNVEEFISANRYLRICADICNRLKHSKLTKPPRSASPIGPFKIKTEITVGPTPEDATVKIREARIDTELGEVCCFDLAARCITEWQSYFKKNEIKSALCGLSSKTP
jgi:hypothetical protein